MTTSYPGAFDGEDVELSSSGPRGGMVITLGSGGSAERSDESNRPDEASSEAAGDASVRPVTARILWPAAGFPAVIAPRPDATGTPLTDGDATRCITVFLLSDWEYLGKEEAAKYLRWVRWKDRGKRHIPEGREGSFRWQDLEVRNDAGKPGLYHLPQKDVLGEVIGWGGDAEHTHAVAGNLAAAVTKFYRDQGLRYLHEIRVGEAASAALGTGTFHLFWNNRSTEEDAPSDEMALLLSRFTPGRRADLDSSWKRYAGYFQQEYEYQYGPLHPAEGEGRPGPRSEILHPLVIRKPGGGRLRVGHLTDLHVAVRNDAYQRNLEEKKTRARFNNWTTSTAACYAAAGKDADIVLLTGDLIDFGRGHWGREARKKLGKDSYYHVDRNWFYFLDLLASGDAYRTPAYTSLGNHDWRINPYPPFAIAGAPNPKSYFHDHLLYSKEEQKALLRIAHDEGHDRLLSYKLEGENRPEKDPWRDLATIVGRAIRWTAKWVKIGWELKSAIGDIILNTTTLDQKDLPTETTVKSVEWYLFTINPFLDYVVQLPTGHALMMLDWAEDEDVLFPIMQGGKAYPYLPWQASTASDPGPKARRCLTDLQAALVTTFLDWPGPKLIGIHSPPIGPYPDWLDGHLLAGLVSYVKHVDGKPAADVARARGPTNFATRYPDGRVDPWFGHPFFAVKPKSGAEGMVPDYGSFDSKRDWFIETLAGRPDVRAVFSGHIHRAGLYVVHRAAKTEGPAIAGQLMVRGLLPEQVGGVKTPRISSLPHGASGPLYINSTSAGPRGNFKRRSETEPEREKGGLSADPGYTRLDLAADGSIEKVAFGFIETGVKRVESFGLVEPGDGLGEATEIYLDDDLELAGESDVPDTADPTEWVRDESEDWQGTESVEEPAWYPGR
jgi:hypothetical protein